MAGRIQGITVEIGGDTTKLQTALKGVNTEIRNTQSQLRDVDKLLKLDPGNTELLAQKHRLLGDAFKEIKVVCQTYPKGSLPFPAFLPSFFLFPLRKKNEKKEAKKR